MSFIRPALHGPRIGLPALLYVALAAFANPAAALGEPERTALETARAGDMRKLTFLETPVPAPTVPMLDPAGAETELAEGNGRYRVVNFWATWCAPCREEMPSLDALAKARPGIDVVLVATGRNTPEAIERFAAEVGLPDLTTYLDPKSRLAAAMNVPGLPVTLILDPEGFEIARLLGGADWAAPDALAIIDLLLVREAEATKD